jgi:hypothetical protein
MSLARVYYFLHLEQMKKTIKNDNQYFKNKHPWNCFGMNVIKRMHGFKTMFILVRWNQKLPSIFCAMWNPPNTRTIMGLGLYLPI